nr:transmembrane protein 272-like [Lytechinus pictus]
MSCFNVEGEKHVSYEDIPNGDISVQFENEKPLDSLQFPNKGDSVFKPPTHSLLYHLNQIKKTALNPVDFAALLGELVINSMYMTVLMGLSIGIPISMLYMGFKYYDKCPAEFLIIFYLLVNGFILTIRQVLDLKLRIQRRLLPPSKRHLPQQMTCGVCCNQFLTFLAISFFLASNIWILSVNPVMNDPHSLKFCHPVLYSYVCWLTIGVYSLLAAGVCFCFGGTVIGCVVRGCD